MEQRFSETELFRSCRILFGDDLNISSEFLNYLQASGIKGAYRKRAMETHPDRFIGQELLLRQQGVGLFHAVQEAYENLLTFLKAKEAGKLIIESHHRSPGETSAMPSGNSSPSQHQSTRNDEWYAPFYFRTIQPITLPEDRHRTIVYTNTERLYQGPLPQRHLLLGHFLYYSGLTNWRTIARILTWQRTERPRLGELGKRFGMFKQEDITTILHARKPFRPFGETAQMLGILTERQVRVLMFHQQRLQKKFGTILLEKNLITQLQLEALLYQFEHHNANVLPRQQKQPSR